MPLLWEMQNAEEENLHPCLSIPSHYCFDDDDITNWLYGWKCLNNIKETNYIGMKINLDDDIKKEIKKLINFEFHRLFSQYSNFFNQITYVKNPVSIQKDENALDKLLELCNKKPKNFSSKKAYAKWVEKGDFD